MPAKGSHIGTLVKPHGYQGALIMGGESDIIEELQEGIPLFVEINGQRVPFFIEECFADSTGKRCTIKFEFIDNDTEARRYVGCDVYSNDKTEGSSDNNEFQKLLNYFVFDEKSGQDFYVKDVILNPENPLLVLVRRLHNPNEAPDKTEYMVPARADYILRFDHKRKRIIAEFPDGLCDW